MKSWHTWFTNACLVLIFVSSRAAAVHAEKGDVDLSPRSWDAEDSARSAALMQQIPVENPLAVGPYGAVTGTYNAPAMRAGLEALKQGGTAADAVATTALAQVALCSGAWVSYAGVMTMVYYDAATGEVYCLNAGYNTVKGEDQPETIPTAHLGVVVSGPTDGGKPSGRTALVPGFMAGIEAAHNRFGKLPWKSIFGPAIYFAEAGFVISPYFAEFMQNRRDVLTRLPETRRVYTKVDGSLYTAGDLFRQPALAATLRRVAGDGAAYMYTGEWARKCVDAVHREGGKMTLEDLRDYEATWIDPVRGSYSDYEIYANGLPDHGGVNTIEALRLYERAGLVDQGHFSESPEALFWLAQIHRISGVNFLAPELVKRLVPSLDLSLQSRLQPATTKEIWKRMRQGEFALTSAPAAGAPKHSDAIVAADRWGNMAAVVHTINTVMWGKTGIVVEGVSINDSASFQQSQIAQTGPGNRLPGPTNPLIVFKAGKPFLAGSSMGSGLHQKTTQCMINVLDFGMNPKQAIEAPYLMFPEYGPAGLIGERVLAGAFDPKVLDDARKLGLKIKELPENSRYAQGLWVGITRDHETGAYSAGSPDVTNGQAFALTDAPASD